MTGIAMAELLTGVSCGLGRTPLLSRLHLEWPLVANNDVARPETGRRSTNEKKCLILMPDTEQTTVGANSGDAQSTTNRRSLPRSFKRGRKSSKPSCGTKSSERSMSGTKTGNSGETGLPEFFPAPREKWDTFWLMSNLGLSTLAWLAPASAEAAPARFLLALLTAVVRCSKHDLATAQSWSKHLETLLKYKDLPNAARIDRAAKFLPYVEQLYRLVEANDSEVLATERCTEQLSENSRRAKKSLDWSDPTIASSLPPLDQLCAKLPTQGPKNRLNSLEELCLVTLSAYLTKSVDLARNAHDVACKFGIPERSECIADSPWPISEGFVLRVCKVANLWLDNNLDTALKVNCQYIPEDPWYAKEALHAYSRRTFQPLTWESLQKDKDFAEAYTKLRSLDAQLRTFGPQRSEDQPLENILTYPNHASVIQEVVATTLLLQLACEGRIPGTTEQRRYVARSCWFKLSGYQMPTPEGREKWPTFWGPTTDSDSMYNQLLGKCCTAVQQDGCNVLQEEVRAAWSEVQQRRKIQEVRCRGLPENLDRAIQQLRWDERSGLWLPNKCHSKRLQTVGHSERQDQAAATSASPCNPTHSGGVIRINIAVD